MLTPPVKKIANRHVARCMAAVEQRIDVPPTVAAAIRREINFCAQDVQDSYERDAECWEGVEKV